MKLHTMRGPWDQVGVNYSFLIELTTTLVNGEHSECFNKDMAEYRRVAERRKFIEGCSKRRGLKTEEQENDNEPHT